MSRPNASHFAVAHELLDIQLGSFPDAHALIDGNDRYSDMVHAALDEIESGNFGPVLNEDGTASEVTLRMLGFGIVADPNSPNEIAINE